MQPNSFGFSPGHPITGGRQGCFNVASRLPLWDDFSTDPTSTVGVIVNRVTSDAHYRPQNAIEHYCFTAGTGVCPLRRRSIT